MSFPKVDWKNWRSELPNKYNVTIVSSPAEVPLSILVTSCSQSKSTPLTRTATATPEFFYQGPMNKRLFAYAKEKNRRFAIISDLHGIHFDNERQPFYDICPGMLSTEDYHHLGNLVRKKCEAEGFSSICFCYPNPLRSLPYFKILLCSGLPIYYCTSFKTKRKGFFQ